MKKAVLGLVFSCIACPCVARASDDSSSSSTDGEDENAAPELVPFRQDYVGGHFQIGATGVLLTPFGNVAKDVGHLSRGGPGGGAQVDLGFGVDRHVFLGAYGEMQWLGKSDSCSLCSANTIGAGLFARYHLVQGMRFDPWVSYGLGYRGLSSDDGETSKSYVGLEWMRLQLGATWYATAQLGLGPVLQLGAGTMIGRPDEEAAGGIHFRAQLGLRLALDLPGR
jgi:hypothetical protein